MNILKTIFLLIGVIGLNACAPIIQVYPNCDVHLPSRLPSLHPSEFGVALISTQQIIIRNKKDRFEFISLLEINPYRLSLAALTPLGQKLFQLQYQKQQLEYNGLGVPSNFDPAFLLTDISLIYGKKSSLNQCFSDIGIPFSLVTGARNIDKNMRRSFNIGTTDKITIDYSTKEVWGSNIIFTNHTRDYSIEIKSLGVERL